MRAYWASSSTHACEGCLPLRRRMAARRSNYCTPPSCDGVEFGPALLVWGPCPARVVDRRKMAANCHCWFGRAQCRSHHLDSPPARAWGPADTRCSPQAHPITAARGVSRGSRPRTHLAKLFSSDGVSPAKTGTRGAGRSARRLPAAALVRSRRRLGPWLAWAHEQRFPSERLFRKENLRGRCPWAIAHGSAS